MKSHLFKLLGLVVLVSLALTACAPAATPTVAPVEPTKAAEPTAAPIESTAAPVEPTAAPAADMLPEVDPSKLEGAVYAAGSSTVYPLAEAIAENFKQDGFAGEIKIDSIGSGGGFKRFCETGETDIATASRGIKDSEKELCGKLNPARTPVEFRVGTDAIAIVVSKENKFLTNVTINELAQIFSDKAEKWSDVNPAWPAEPIQRFIPGTDSGTFDFFIEFVTAKAYKDDPEVKKAKDAAEVTKIEKGFVLNAKNTQPSEDDNVLVQGVEASPYAIGFFGFAYFKNNEAKLNAVSIDNVAPSFETAEDGTYALSRPLFLYSDAAILKSKPQVAGFINYFLTNTDDVIGKVGYFPLNKEAMKASKQAWLDALK